MKENISEKKQGIDFAYDSIVIKKHGSDLEGGRTLDMTGYPLNVLYAAHVIISQVVNSEKVYKPLPIVAQMEDVYTEVASPSGNPASQGWYEESEGVYTETADTEVASGKTYYTKSEVEQKDEDGNTVYAYGEKPAGAKYEGVLYRSILKDKPAASVMFEGIVNDKVMKFQLGTHASGFAADVKGITFKNDEEA